MKRGSATLGQQSTCNVARVQGRRAEFSKPESPVTVPTRGSWGPLLQGHCVQISSHCDLAGR